jgi:hypothetical protein
VPINPRRSPWCVGAVHTCACTESCPRMFALGGGGTAKHCSDPAALHIALTCPSWIADTAHRRYISAGAGRQEE